MANQHKIGHPVPAYRSNMRNWANAKWSEQQKCKSHDYTESHTMIDDSKEQRQKQTRVTLQTWMDRKLWQSVQKASTVSRQTTMTTLSLIHTRLCDAFVA